MYAIIGAGPADLSELPMTDDVAPAPHHREMHRSDYCLPKFLLGHPIAPFITRDALNWREDAATPPCTNRSTHCAVTWPTPRRAGRLRPDRGPARLSVTIRHRPTRPYRALDERHLAPRPLEPG